MTKIEKAVKIVSDLYDFYRQIPQIAPKNPMGEEKDKQALQPTARERALHSSESPLEPRRRAPSQEE
jgi:hypothetical protein